MLRVLADEVRNRAHGDGGGEAIGLADDPVRHETAIRPTPDANAFGVDKAQFEHLIERGHQVDVVFAAPVADDRAPEGLAVAVGAAGVHVEDHEAHAGKNLQLVEERPAVLRVRPAVDLHHGGIELVLVKAGRLEQPAFQLPSVGCGEVVLLGLGDVAVAKPRIEVCHARFSAAREHVQLAGILRVRCAEDRRALGDVEVIDSAPAPDLVADVAVQVDRFELGHARPGGEEVDAIAFLRPHGPGQVTRTHVVDDAVVDSLVEIEGQAPRATTGERNDPEPLDQAHVEAVRREKRDHVALRRPDR